MSDACATYRDSGSHSWVAAPNDLVCRDCGAQVRKSKPAGRRIPDINWDNRAKELGDLWEHSFASAHHTISDLRVEVWEKHPNFPLPDIEATAMAIANHTVKCYTDGNLDSIEIYHLAWDLAHFLLWREWRESPGRDPAQPLPWVPPVDETIQDIAVRMVNHQSYIPRIPPYTQSYVHAPARPALAKP